MRRRCGILDPSGPFFFSIDAKLELHCMYVAPNFRGSYCIMNIGVPLDF